MTCFPKLIVILIWGIPNWFWFNMILYENSEYVRIETTIMAYLTIIINFLIIFSLTIAQWNMSQAKIYKLLKKLILT